MGALRLAGGLPGCADQTFMCAVPKLHSERGRAWCILSFMPSFDEVKSGLLQILENNGYNVSGLTGDSQIPTGSSGGLAAGISDKWRFNIAADEMDGAIMGGSQSVITLDQLARLIAD